MKYKLSLSSDLNFDIALQRCFTELFQGYTFDLSFPMKMQKIFDFDKISTSNWNMLEKDCVYQEIFKQAKNGTGYLPLEFYKNSETVQDLNIFNNGHLDNLEVFNQLLIILKRQGLKLYIKDYSYAGFPTFRVFISTVSGSHHGSLKFRLKISQIVTDFYDKLRKGNENDITNAIHVFNKNHVDVNLEEILHIKLQNCVTVDLKKIEIFFEMKSKNYQQAYLLYCKYFGDYQNGEYVKLYLLSLCSRNDKVDFMSNEYAFTNSNCLRFLKEFLNEFSSFYFPNICTGECTCCQNEPFCLTPKIQVICKKVNSLCLNYNISHEDYLKKLML